MNTLQRIACAAAYCALGASSALAQSADPANPAAAVPPTIYHPAISEQTEPASKLRPDQRWQALNRDIGAHPAMKMGQMPAMPSQPATPMPMMMSAPAASTPHMHSETP